MAYDFAVRNPNTGFTKMSSDYEGLCLFKTVTGTGIRRDIGSPGIESLSYKDDNSYSFKEQIFPTSTFRNVFVAFKLSNEYTAAYRTNDYPIYDGTSADAQRDQSETWAGNFAKCVSEVAIASTLYLFGPTPDLASVTPGYGMRIRRESDSRVMFDTRYKYLRIYDVIERNNHSYFTYNLPHANFAALFFIRGWRWYIDRYRISSSSAFALETQNLETMALRVRGTQLQGNRIRDYQTKRFWLYNFAPNGDTTKNLVYSRIALIDLNEMGL